MPNGLRGSLLALSIGCLLACSDAPNGPPPLPVVNGTGGADKNLPPPLPDVRPAARRDDRAVEPAPRAERQAPTTPAPRKARVASTPAPSAPRKAREEAPPPQATAPPPRIATPAPPPKAAPAPAPARAAKPKNRVVVPQTQHIRTDITEALQADLDADPRMQAWLERAMAVIDGCHAKERMAVGTVQATLTMHESARPTFTLGSLSPRLGGVVACATSQLMRIKMPLFTGREGTRHTVRVSFQ